MTKEQFNELRIMSDKMHNAAEILFYDVFITAQNTARNYQEGFGLGDTINAFSEALEALADAKDKLYLVCDHLCNERFNA